MVVGSSTVAVNYKVVILSSIQDIVLLPHVLQVIFQSRDDFIQEKFT